MAALAARHARKAQLAAMSSALEHDARRGRRRHRAARGRRSLPHRDRRGLRQRRALATPCAATGARATARCSAGWETTSRTRPPGAPRWSSTRPCWTRSARDAQARARPCSSAAPEEGHQPIQRELAPRQPFLTPEETTLGDKEHEQTPHPETDRRLRAGRRRRGPAFAQTKLKWAHVYETSEPYHKWSVWAADEFKKRTNGKYEIQVFPASSLGKESDINQGLHWARWSSSPAPSPRAPSRAWRQLPPLHLPGRRPRHQVQQERRLQGADRGYKKASGGNTVTALTYYGARRDQQQAVHQLRPDEG